MVIFLEMEVVGTDELVAAGTYSTGAGVCCCLHANRIERESRIGSGGA